MCGDWSVWAWFVIMQFIKYDPWPRNQSCGTEKKVRSFLNTTARRNPTALLSSFFSHVFCPINFVLFVYWLLILLYSLSWIFFFFFNHSLSQFCVISWFITRFPIPLLEWKKKFAFSGRLANANWKRHIYSDIYPLVFFLKFVERALQCSGVSLWRR